MNRCVLLVDAGYLFAQGGLVVHGTKSRRELTLDAAKFVTDISEQVVDHCSLPLLRTYWYDGAKNGIPTKQHLEVAHLPYLKLRLGRLNGKNQQKGVDALIYRDLMTLASERSVAQAYLLSGDDDLREGVLFAQDRGVRVVLLGIPNDHGNSAQSQELRYEADEVKMLDRSVLSASLQRTPTLPAVPISAVDATRESSGSEGAPAGVGVAAEEFAVSWCDAATTEALNALVADYPVIPRPLDADLMRSCEIAIGRSLRSDQDSKKLARRSFWTRVKAAAAADIEEPGD